MTITGEARKEPVASLRSEVHASNKAVARLENEVQRLESKCKALGEVAGAGAGKSEVFVAAIAEVKETQQAHEMEFRNLRSSMELLNVRSSLLSLKESGGQNDAGKNTAGSDVGGDIGTKDEMAVNPVKVKALQESDTHINKVATPQRAATSDEIVNLNKAIQEVKLCVQHF